MGEAPGVFISQLEANDIQDQLTLQIGLLRKAVGADALILRTSQLGDMIVDKADNCPINENGAPVQSVLFQLNSILEGSSKAIGQEALSSALKERVQSLGIAQLLMSKVQPAGGIQAGSGGAQSKLGHEMAHPPLHDSPGFLLALRQSDDDWTLGQREDFDRAVLAIEGLIVLHADREANQVQGELLRFSFDQLGDVMFRLDEELNLSPLNRAAQLWCRSLLDEGRDDRQDIALPAPANGEDTPASFAGSMPAETLMSLEAVEKLQSWIADAGSEPLQFADHFVGHDGEHWLEWTISENAQMREFDARFFACGRDLTEQRNLEKMVLESDTRLRRIFNDVPANFLVLDRVGRIGAVNRHWAEQLGFGRDEIVGRQLSSFMTDASSTMMRRILNPKLLREGRIEDSRIDFITKDGETVQTVLSASAERDQDGRVKDIFCITKDISRQIQALENIERQRIRFEAIVQDQSELISRFLADGTLIFVNDAFCRFFSMDDVDLLGRSVFDVWPQPASDELRERLRNVAGEDNVTAEIAVEIEGNHRWLFSTERAITGASGEIAEFQSVARDISKERQATHLLTENQKRLRRIIDQLFVFVAILTPKGELIEINQAPLEMAGVKREDVLHKTFADGPWWRYSDDSVDRLREAVRLAAKGENLRYDINVETINRKHVTLDFQIAPLLDEKGEVTQLVASGVDITARKDVEQRFEHAAMHDSLTGLSNRSLFRIGLERENERLARDGGCLALMSIDLDHFKQVNDNFGHSVGDGLLKQVAVRLERCTRRTDILARLGGDEFAVVVGSKQPGEHLEALARRIVGAINKPFEVDGHRVKIGASLGLAVIDEACADVEELINRSDMALYAAKETGRGTWKYYQSAMTERVRSKRRAEKDLADAIRNDQLELHYQPIIASDDQKLIGIEGLVRWNHPERGIITPRHFLGLAESLGLVNAIRSWVLNKALMQHQGWRERGLLDVPVSINLGHIGQDGDLLFDEITGAIEKVDGSAKDLVVDFAESEVAEGSAVLGLIQNLEDAGIGVAIDDFGTGATSIARLGLLPATQLKIDGTILSSDKIGFDPVSMVTAIVNIARANGMMTIMEAVENADQLEVARSAGCAAVQGFFIKRPAASADLEAWLIESASKSAQSSVKH